MAFIAIMLLRLAVGFHFYQEGTQKLRNGFTSEPFLRAAKGPLAPFYHQLLQDDDGEKRLCLEREEGPDGELTLSFDTELTFALWEDFVDQARSYYRFGDTELLAKLAQRRQVLAEKIKQARIDKTPSIDTGFLEDLRFEDEQSILAIREQDQRAPEILSEHKDQLLEMLNANRIEIFQHYQTENRLEGFERDGDSRQQVATSVTSLREQVDSIRNDRQKQLKEWTADIEAIWDSLEIQINSLAADEQSTKPLYKMHRNFDQEYGKSKLVDRIIPWFDTIIGALLILGLFTRIAALAGGLFLLSVIASQPPWVPGTIDTYYQSVEMFAMLVLFATCAGRFAGLDYFFSNNKNNNVISPSESSQPS